MSGAATLERGQLQRRELQLFFRNLELLHIEPLHGAEFNERDFRGKNASATAKHVLHGIYSVYNKKQAQKTMKNIWPVKPGESDKEFRGVIFNWISTLQEDPIATPFLQGFNASLLLRPGTPQYLMFLSGLSTFVLQDRLKDQIELAVDFSHEALPRNVIKFATQEKKSSFVTLQKQLKEIEADHAEQERHFKELLSNLNLRLNTLRVEAESHISDESFDRLTQIHKGLLEQREMISTRMEQIEEHCAQLEGVTTIDLVGGLEKCNAVSTKFLQGYNKKTLEDHHRSVAAANVELNALKKTVQRLQAQRHTLEGWKAETRQRLQEAISRLPAEMLAELGMKTTAGTTRPQVSVDDLIARLSAAFGNPSSRQS